MNTINKLMTAWNLSESDTRDVLELLDAVTWAGGEDLDCIEYAGTIDNPDNPNKLCGHTGYWIADHGGAYCLYNERGALLVRLERGVCK